MCEASGGPARSWQGSRGVEERARRACLGPSSSSSLFSGLCGLHGRQCESLSTENGAPCIQTVFSLLGMNRTGSASRVVPPQGPAPQEELLWGCVTIERHRPQNLSPLLGTMFSKILTGRSRPMT